MVDVLDKIKLLPERHWLGLLILNPGAGNGATVTCLVMLSLQPFIEVATSLTLKVPAVT